MTQLVRWGILSTANIAQKRFIPGVQKSGNGVVAAIASRDLEQARQVAEALSIPRAYGSYQELIEDPNVDAVYIPLPNSMHAEWTIKAAAAGKPVLCEKPLALTSSQALTMIEACRRHHVLLMEAFMYRCHPQQALVRSLIDGGAIGDLRFVRSAFTFMLEPFPPGNVRLSAELGGGALMDVGCYAVNAARMLFGVEPVAASALWDLRPEFGVEVSLAGILDFGAGRFATFDCGFRAPGRGSYTAVGTNGQIEVSDAFVPAEVDLQVRVTRAGETVDQLVPGVDQYQLEAEEFADALLNARRLHIPATDAVANLRAIEALHLSASREGERQSVSAG
ncbi:MAG: Gfo/Idh/MocA family oxidoreductase [Candidatus Dormiibacterota bacterium]